MQALHCPSTSSLLHSDSTGRLCWKAWKRGKRSVVMKPRGQVRRSVLPQWGQWMDTSMGEDYTQTHLTNHATVRDSELRYRKMPR